MKRLRSSFVGFIFAVSVFGLFSYVSQETPRAAAADNIWTGSISVSELESVTPTQLINRFDCEYQSARGVFIPDTSIYAEGATPSFINEEFFELGEKCIVKNRQGVFTSQFTQSTYDTFTRSAYYGPDRARMFNVYPQGTQWLDPAPRTDTVLLLSHTALTSTTYTVTEITDYSDSKPEVRRGQLVWPTPTEGSDYWRDKNGQSVKIYNHFFSSNGRYMVIQYDRVVAKVDLYTKELTPFLYQRYATGGEFAISNDGRYVAQLQDGLFVHDTELCENRYSYGNWDVGYKPFVYPGCSVTSNLIQPLRASGDLSPMSVIAQYRQPYFTENGSGVILAEGVRNSSGLPGLDGYDWTRHELHADSYASSAHGYLAIGDSFSSGEGDGEGGTWYEPGTDEQGNKDTFEGRNLCHLSRRSYPYLIAKELGYIPNTEDPYTPLPDDPFHSVACSGAKIHNIAGGANNGLVDYLANEDVFRDANNQYSYHSRGELNDWQPGHVKQLDFLTGDNNAGIGDTLTPEIITVGIGGNDAEFGSILLNCVIDLSPGSQTCDEAVSGSLKNGLVAARIADQKKRLTESYKAVKSEAPDSKVYVYGYPLFIKGYEGDCGNNVRLNSQETALVEEGIKYMNRVVQSAAAEAGVIYIDVEGVLAGTNLCADTGNEKRTVNGLTRGDDKGDFAGTVINLLLDVGVGKTVCLVFTECGIANESFHPNQHAQPLLKNEILAQTNNLKAEMPQPVAQQIPLPQDYFGEEVQQQVQAQNISDGFYGWDVVVPERKASVKGGEEKLIVETEGILANSEVTVTIHSDPIVLGTFYSDENGTVSIEFRLPTEIENGMHEIHILGVDKFGAEVDHYAPIIVGSVNDFDGDGIMDSEDSCPSVKNINLDEDDDGVDDSCDNEVVVAQEPDNPPSDPDDSDETGETSTLKSIFTRLIRIVIKFFSKFWLF